MLERNGELSVLNIDWTILNGIQSYIKCGFLDFLMPKITMLGNGGLIWIAAAIILLCTKRYRKYGIILLAALLIGSILCNVILKNAVGRLRPFQINTDFQLLIHPPGGFSFPSGHTMASVIAATVLTKTNHKFGYFAIPLAALIAFSRLYLYVHFPSDVAFSAVTGIIIANIIFIAGQKVKINFLNRL